MVSINSNVMPLHQTFSVDYFDMQVKDMQVWNFLKRRAVNEENPLILPKSKKRLVSEWTFIHTFWTKPLPQNRHLCSLVSVWIFSCRFNDPIVGNSLLQNLHGSPLNSEWVLTCAGKFLLRTFLLHTSHSTSYNIARQNCIHTQLLWKSIRRNKFLVLSRFFWIVWC